MSDQPTGIEDILEALETRLEAVEKKTQQLSSEEKIAVAFSASAEKGGRHGPYDTDVIMPYNKVITNVGDAFNSATGIFVAPVTGVYCFTFFYHAGGEHESSLKLFKNSEQIVKSSDHISSDRSDNGGNAAVLQLDQGDQVFMHLPAGGAVWADDGHTTFSGFLVC